MFISSIILYLLIRKSTLLKTPTELNNLAMMALPVVFYIIAPFKKVNYSITPYAFAIIFISAIFFSYLGNLFSLKSIEQSPNPGYSLIISKSYVVFTTIASIFLFNSALTLKSAFAIVLIIFFSILLVVDKTANKQVLVENKRWLVLAIAAFFCWGMLAIASKYLLIIGVDIITRLIYSMTISSLFVVAEIAVKKYSVKDISLQQAFVLLLIGISATAFNYYMQVGFDLAPNIGYVNAVNAASIAGVSLFSSILFKDELTPRKYIGVLGVILGLILLVVNK